MTWARTKIAVPCEKEKGQKGELWKLKRNHYLTLCMHADGSCCAVQEGVGDEFVTVSVRQWSWFSLCTLQPE